MSRSPRAGATDLGNDPAEAGTDQPDPGHPDTLHPGTLQSGTVNGGADTGYRPVYDPGRLDPPTHPDLQLPAPDATSDPGPGEATTSVFAAVPAQTGRDGSLDHTWAGPTWDQHSWDRPDYDDDPDYDGDPDYDDEPDEHAGFGEFGAPEQHPAAPELVEAQVPHRARLAVLLLPVVVGVVVSIGLGVYARVHEGTGTAINLAGFSSGLAAKSWLTTAAFVLVLVQLWTSLRMYGRLGTRRPAGPRTGTVHRWSGRLAVVVTIPVAVHCLYALGFSDANLRVLVHSLLGCFFYGAFAAKMLVLPRRDSPRWAVPVLGGLLFAVLSGIVLTSAVWFFATKGLTF